MTFDYSLIRFSSTAFSFLISVSFLLKMMLFVHMVFWAEGSWEDLLCSCSLQVYCSQTSASPGSDWDLENVYFYSRLKFTIAKSSTTSVNAGWLKFPIFSSNPEQAEYHGNQTSQGSMLSFLEVFVLPSVTWAARMESFSLLQQIILVSISSWTHLCIILQQLEETLTCFFFFVSLFFYFRATHVTHEMIENSDWRTQGVNEWRD